MNITKLLKDGNKGKAIPSILIFISIYIIGTIIFFIYNRFFEYIFHAPNKPIILYIIKWIYAILLIIGVLKLKNSPHTSYLLINTISVCVLLLSFITMYYWFFYMSIIDIILLEIVSVGLIIMTNLKSFIQENNIKRKLSDFIFVCTIPIALTLIIKYSFEYFYYGRFI